MRPNGIDWAKLAVWFGALLVAVVFYAGLYFLGGLLLEALR